MQLTGRVFITIKGKRLRSKDGATLKYGGVKREGQTADTGVAGYIESTEIPGIDCVLMHAADVSLQEILDIKEETAVFETDTGRSFVLGETWCTGGLELSKGEVKVGFQAMTCEES